MKYPDEWDEIISRIREMAGHGKPFTCYDLICCWMSKHYSNDWEECLAYLVKEGELSKNGTYYKKEEQTMAEIKKVYKPLVEKPDGKLVSIWAGHNKRPGVTLEYREGGITYTPEGGAGIWASSTLGEAERQLRNKVVEGVFVIHEATALGESYDDSELDVSLESPFFYDLRYPAILLGKEVWREKPRISHSFKVGDKVRLRVGITEPTYGFADSWRSPKDVGIIQDIIGNLLHVNFPSIEDYSGDAYSCKPSEMELAPGWVDVTKECEAKVRPSGIGYYLELSHQGHWLIEAGIDKSRINTFFPNYKIEDNGEAATPGTFHRFRVFNKTS